jgi:hypothetical protein
MSMRRVLGLVLLAAGAVSIVIGVVASRSLADNVSTVFTGHLTRDTTWYIFGGIGAAVLGGVLAYGVLGRSRS